MQGPISLCEMRSGCEAGRNCNLDHRHSRLLDHLPGAIETKVEVVARRPRTQILHEQALHLAQGHATRLRQVRKWQRAFQIVFHCCDDVKQAWMAHSGSLRKCETLRFRRLSCRMMQHLVCDARTQFSPEIGGDEVEHQVKRSRSPGTCEAIASIGRLFSVLPRSGISIRTSPRLAMASPARRTITRALLANRFWSGSLSRP